MTISTYVDGRGFLYRIDPRIKLVMLIFLCVLFLLPCHVALTYAYVSLLMILAVFSIGWRNGFGILKSIAPMLIFMVIFSPFSSRGGEPLIRIGSFMLLSREGALHTAVLMGRFTAITYACFLFFATTPMMEVVLALRFYRLPYPACLLVTLVFRYIPFIAECFVQIKDSHRLRRSGSDYKESRIREFIPTLTCALVFSLKSIPNLAMSLENRGFGYAKERSSYHSLDHYSHRGVHIFLFVVISATILAVLYT